MVRNISGNSLAMSLEKGSTILGKGKSLDIDGLCSRKWIRTNKELRQLLDPNVNALILMHDSEQGVQPQITHDARKNIPKSKAKKKEKPVIIDFSDVGEPEQEDPIVEDLSEPEEVVEEVEEVVEAPVKTPEKETDDEMTIEEPEWKEDEKKVIPDGMVACPICGKLCKGERGLNAHTRLSHKEN